MSKSDILILAGNNLAPSSREALETLPGAKSAQASIGQFVSGEPFVELFRGGQDAHFANKNALKDSRVFIVQSTDEPVSEQCMQLLLAAHTCKRYGAGRVVAMLPFRAFDRQDREYEKRFTSVASELFPRLLKEAGVDEVITFTPHSHAAMQHYHKIFGEHFKALAITDLFADSIKAAFPDNLGQVMVGAPDGADKPEDAGQARAQELAQALFGDQQQQHRFMISKTHTGVNDTKITGFEGNVQGKHCIIVDDMIDRGSTMINAATLLKARGAASVTAYATHGILTGDALEKILTAKHDGMHGAIDRLVITNSLPSAAQKLDALRASQPALAQKVELLPIDPLLAHEIGQKQAVGHSMAI